MPAYSNRPGYGEPLPMGSDFQAIPRAPRAPHFPEPSARGQHYGHSYAQTGPFPPFAPHSARNVPPAPGSLSPVAMASSRSAVATGAHQPMDAGASRPSSKAGMSILLAGAIIGGLFGAVMHARQNAADAIAASMHEPAPVVAPPSASSAPPLAPIAPVASASASASPSSLLANLPNDGKDAKGAIADKKDDKKAKTGTKKLVWTGGGKKAGVAETVAGADEPDTTTASSGKKKKAKDDDDGYTVASADGSKSDKSDKSDSGSSSSSKADKKDASSKKADRDTKSSGEKKNSSAGKGGDDAVNVLKAAMGATENTL